MTENLLTNNPADDDLLAKIQRETQERLCELRDAVEEHDRLQAELSALDAPPEPPADPEPFAAPEAIPEPPVASGPPATLDIEPEPPAVSKPFAALQGVPKPSVISTPPVAPEPSANVVRLPVRPRLPRTRMVSPKIARLMCAPRRPALERTGVVRVGAGRLDSSGDEPVEEINSEVALYERSNA